VSKVKNRGIMIEGAHVSKENISSWAVSIATNMSSLFAGAHVFNENISSWEATIKLLISSVSDLRIMLLAFASPKTHDHSSDRPSLGRKHKTSK
jgi:hypothetical protein